MKIGARILKTGVAVGIALYVSHFLRLDPIIFAGIAAAISVQPSLYRSWKSSLEQIQANVVGAVIGILLAVLLGTAPYTIALGIIIVISINLQLKFDRSIPLSMVTVLAIMGSPMDSFWEMAGDRFLLIFIGILASMLTNVLFPPRHEKRLLTELYEVHEAIVQNLRLLADVDWENTHQQKEIERLSEKMGELRNLFSLHSEENYYARRKKLFHKRRMVVYRKMVHCCEKGVETIHQLFAQLISLVAYENVRQLMSHELQKVALYQEKIFLKFSGQIKHADPDQTVNDEYRLLTPRDVLHQYKENEEVLLFLFPIVQQLNELYTELSELDHIVEQYYHSPSD